MRRITISFLLVICLFCFSVPVLAEENHYDSNGVTAFYGKYEYPKEKPNKKFPEKKRNEGEPNYSSVPRTNDETTHARILPTYNKVGKIIPMTGDTTNVIPTLLGILLLGLVLFKLKEGEDAEKNSIT